MKNSGGISIQMNYSALPRVVVSGPAAPASPECWLDTQDCAQACSAEEQVLTRSLGDWYEY